MKSNLNQFVPSEVCLHCDRCCRFKEENSAWRPKMAKEEIAQLRKHPKTSKILSFPNVLVGNPDEAMIGPPTKTFGGDNFRITSSKKKLANLILSKEIFSQEGSIKTVSCHGDHLCSFFNPGDHTCRIYSARPFECQLYPFILTRKNQQPIICVHRMCPFIQQKRATQDFDDYVAYLKNFFQEKEVLTFLKRNPELVGDYSDYQAELEYLFGLPFSVIANDQRE